MKRVSLLLVCFLLFIRAFTQQENYSWHYLNQKSLHCEHDSVSLFCRLSAILQAQKGDSFRNPSLNGNRTFLHFKTSARNFEIRYVLTDKHHGMTHTLAADVGGVDLYAMDMDGRWDWMPPHYFLGDTCVFVYRNIKVEVNHAVADFYLYLPLLYNTVKWISIGTPKDEQFSFAPPRREKPIVTYLFPLRDPAALYAGLAWTNILERSLDRKVINLSTSANGFFERSGFNLMARIDAELYVIDCIPNSTQDSTFSDAEIKRRIYYGVQILRKNHPSTPILFIQRSCMPSMMASPPLHAQRGTNTLIVDIFNHLKIAKAKNIHLFIAKDSGLNIDGTIEGGDVNDVGVMRLPIAFEKMIRQILNEPKGNTSTKIPVEQYRDGYDWIKRHEDVIINTVKTNPKIMLFGNSIINYWGGFPAAESGLARGSLSWQKYMLPQGIQNAGFGWDRVENVLWRVYHGALDNFTGNKIIVMIGTNNLGLNTDEDIVSGLSFLLQQMHDRKPNVQLTMVGILPRKGMERQVEIINQKIKSMVVGNGFLYTDFSKAFLSKMEINTSLFTSDGLHPNKDGYEVLGKCIKKYLCE